MAKEIIIRILSEQPDSPSPDALDGDGKNSPEKEADGKKKKNKDLKKLLKAHVFNQVWRTAKNLGLQYANKYFDATENYRAKTAVDNAVSTIDFGFSSFVAIKASSVLFADTSIGAVGGFAIGLTSVALNKGIETFNTYLNESQRIINNAYSNYFYSERAGYVAGGHGTEN